MITLSIVIPVYNEEESLPFLFPRLNEVIDELKQESGFKNLLSKEPQIEVLFVNDGSIDNTQSILESLAINDASYRYINLSRNFGHQAAVSAGIKYARGKAVVIMDGDLQDPPELIKDMVAKWKEGAKVVYAVRRKREGNFFKKLSYKIYYRLNSFISDYPVQKDSGDFSLLDRKVVDAINKLPEKSRYLRGLRAWVGFKQARIEYDREERGKGLSKYSFISLVKLAFMGITSTSVKPLFLSGLFSLVSLIVVIGIIFYVLFAKLYLPDDLMPKGWSSIMITVAFLSGLQLVSIWLLSLYIANMYKETLSRPTYIVDYDSALQRFQTDK
ncbi:MAG: glycosyltransferase family 2 protein [Candidatus Omnitrophica bacterium]|nr:glycosyltransferase family 2 protein [Candidatus Omnitrophota bacterium]